MTPERSMVDETLVAEMLALTPEERLRQNDRAVATAESLRRAFRAREPHDPAIEPRR